MPRNTSGISELGNIAASLDESELKKLGFLCYEDYKQDQDDRRQWLEKHAEYERLYHQIDYPDTPPWDGASQESSPLMTEACNMYQSRAFKAFFPSRDFIQAIPGDPSALKNDEAAQRVAKHMSYQLSIEDRSYKTDKNAMFLATSIHGSDFTKTYRDPIRGRNRIERVRATDLVVPYGRGPRRLEDIDRKSQIIWTSQNNSNILASKKWFLSPLKPCTLNEKGDPIQAVQDQVSGLNESNSFRMDRQCCAIEQHRLLDLDDDGIAEPYIVWFDLYDQSVKRIQVRYEIDKDGKPFDEFKPKEYFTHYPFLSNPDGFYGLGMGHVIGKLNIAVNKILRQTIDAGELANIGNQSGFISESAGIHGDYVELELGLFKKIPRTVQDIHNAIYQFEFPGPNVAYMDMMKYLENVAQRASASTDAVTGDIEKVMQPLTILTLLESSLQLPTAVMEQQAFAFEEELMKLYKLNQKYFTGEYIVDKTDLLMVTPEDYSNNYRIVPIIDPKQITRQQKMAKSQQIYDFVIKDPMLSQNPAALKEAQKRVLTSMDVEDLDQILIEQKPKNIKDQNEENMYFLLPPSERPLFDVFPDQNHHDHIAKIDTLIEMMNLEVVPDVDVHDPQLIKIILATSAQIKAKILVDLLEHRQKHVAYLYGNQTGVLDGQGRSSAMETGEGDSMGNTVSQGAVPGQPMAGMPAGGPSPPTGQSGSPPVPPNASGILGITTSATK